MEIYQSRRYRVLWPHHFTSQKDEKNKLQRQPFPLPQMTRFEGRRPQQSRHLWCLRQINISHTVNYASTFENLPSKELARLLFSMNSYTNIRLLPSTQQPTNWTRFGCLIFEIKLISVKNSVVPCFDSAERRLMATRVPSLKIPCNWKKLLDKKSLEIFSQRKSSTAAKPSITDTYAKVAEDHIFQLLY